jgi:PII-like signaling protein
MTESSAAVLLRVFVGELDTHAGQPLYQWLIEEAKRRGLAGATALRGLEGFGVHHQLHTAKVLHLSVDLPIIVEIIDTEANIEAFLPVLNAAMAEGIATTERVEARFYGSE